MIRFGSRTELFLPKAAVEAQVRPGDRVKAGETIVGRWTCRNILDKAPRCLYNTNIRKYKFLER